MSSRKKFRTRFSDELVDLRSRLAELDHEQGAVRGKESPPPTREDLHYQAIRENIDEMVYRIDYDQDPFHGQVIFLSPQVKFLTGHTEREFKSNRKLWLKSIHADDQESFRSGSEAIWTSRQSGVLEYRFLHGKSKAYHWFEDTMVPEFDDAGRLVGSLGVVRDITERKTAESTRNMISAAVEQINDIVFITNRDGILIYLNDAMVELTGYQRKELLGQTPQLFKSGQHKPRFFKDFWNRILAGKVFRGTFINKKKSGEQFYLETTVTPVRNFQGEIAHFVATGSDVTVARQAAAELQAVNLRYLTVWASTNDGLRLTDAEGVIIDVNAAYCELAESTRDDLIGKVYPAAYQDAHSAEWTLEEYRRAFSKENFAEDSEHELTFLSGRSATAKVTSTFVDIPDRPRLLLTVIYDLSQQRNLDRAIQLSEVTKDISRQLAGLGYWEYDGDDGKMEWSGELENILGLAPGKVQPNLENFLERIHPDDRSRMKGTFERIQSGGGFEMECRFLWPDGTKRLASIRARLVGKSSNGSPRLVGTVEDITEQRDLEDSHQRFETILNSSHNILGMVNRDYILEAVNDACRKAFTTSAETITGQSLTTLAGEEAFNEELRPLLDKAFSGVEVQADCWLELGSQELRCYHLTYHPFHDDQQSITHVILTLRDITDSVKAEETLVRSETTFAGILDSAPDAVISMDMDQNIFLFNKSAERIFGYKAKEIIGRPLNTLIPENLQADHDAGVATFAAGQEDSRHLSENDPVVARRKNGEEFPLEASISRLVLPDRTVLSVVARDISARHKSEQSLRESEHKLASHARNSPVAFIEWDHRLRVINWNAAAEKLFGYSLKAARGKSATDLILPTKSKDRPKQLLGLLESQQTGLYQLEANVNAAGEALRCEWYYTPLFSAAGQLQGVASLVQDVSARLEAEKASATEQERLRSTIHSLGDAVIAVNSTGKVLLINQMAEILLERKESDVLGKRLEKIFPLINSNDGTEKIFPGATNLKPKQSITFEQDTVLLTGKDHRRHIAGKIKPMITPSGDVSGAVISFYDNTDKELLEAEQLKNQKLESLEIFSSGFALDFNNHLSSIALNLSAMQLQTDKDPQLAELLQDTAESIKRAKGVTSLLATFTQGARPAKSNVLLTPILKETIHQVLQGSDVKPAFQLGKDIWPAAVDVNMISQAILLLTRNAVQAMELGGNLRITVKNVTATEQKPVGPLAPGKYVEVSIEDEGKGFSPEIGERIYDPYFTTRSGALGLGLFVVHGIINQHDGWITFKSQVDKGTKFTFYLPAVSNVVATPMEKLPEFASGTGNVLILDCDELIRNALRRFLRTLGYTVGTASTPHEASAKVAHAVKTGKSFNVIFIDLALPDGTRAEKLLHAIRRNDREIKAILTAGAPSAPEIVKSQEYGFQGRLIKPYNTTELSRVLAEMLPAVTKP